ncbi:hypothetical protein PIB30_030333 [Stylosanthes scabra]|uniref:Uncharacterized protein n=1 Tax=Stylosanthes scabra TaxID=79078 RepID=A0ABU6UES2_9FABA|nr:hypothetical protein [Stylosanthes scabra]
MRSKRNHTQKQGTVARARHGKGAGTRSNGGPKARLNGLADAWSKGRKRADLAVVGLRAPSTRARTRHGHRADARPCARAKGGARMRHKLVLLRPNVIKLTARTRQDHRASARGVRARQ